MFRTEGSTQFDRGNKIQLPLHLLAGGYIGIFTVNSGSGWQQQTAEKHPTNSRNRRPVGSRRERRNMSPRVVGEQSAATKDRKQCAEISATVEYDPEAAGSSLKKSCGLGIRNGPANARGFFMERAR